MTKEQKDSLESLRDALLHAHKTGAINTLYKKALYTETVNDFCDTVYYLVAMNTRRE